MSNWREITWESNYSYPIRTAVIGHSRDHAPITEQLGARRTNHDGAVYYRYDYAFYYINPSEITGELSRVNLISSHPKITWYFTCENNMLLFSEVIRSLVLWLYDSLKVIRCVSVSRKHHRLFLRNFWQPWEMFGNIRNHCLDFGKLLENLRKTLRKCSEIFGKLSKTTE